MKYQTYQIQYLKSNYSHKLKEMKKSIYSVLVILLMANFVNAQIVKTNPLGLAFGNINAKYEHVINDKQSVQVGAKYIYKFLIFEVNGFGVDGEYRFFVMDKPSPNGLYVGPSLSFNYLKQKYNDFFEEAAYSITTLGVGGTIGFQWVTKGGFCIDTGIGPQYTLELTNDSESSYSGFLPRVALSIGYKFK